MTKAYDVTELGLLVIQEAKKDGLHLAEEGIQTLSKAVYNATKQWAKESAKISDNHIDDMLAPFYDYLDSMVLNQIEKIDLDGKKAA